MSINKNTRKQMYSTLQHSSLIDTMVLTIIETAKAVGLVVLLSLFYYKISITNEPKIVEAIQVGHPVAPKYLTPAGGRVV